MKKIFLLTDLCLAFGLAAPRILFAESGLVFDQTQGMLTGQLNVSSNIVAAGSVTASSATFTNTAGAGLTVNSSAYLAVAGGNVGIGTTVPEEKLVIAQGDSGAVGPIIRLRTNSFGANKEIGALEFRNNNTAVYTASIRSWAAAYDNNLDLRFFTVPDGTGPQERMRINSSGNVGIGTVSPGALLHVAKDEGGAFGAGAGVLIDNPDADGLGGASALRLMRASVTKWALVNDINGDATDDFTLWGQGGVKAITLKATSGNVGIGTTSPAVMLDVFGKATIGNAPAGSRASNNNGLAIYNAVNTATSLFVWENGVGSGHVGFAANDNKLRIVNSYSDGLISNPAAIVLDTSGNLGVGTTNPSAQLESQRAGVAGANVDALALTARATFPGGPTLNTTVGVNFNLGQDTANAYTYAAIRGGEDVGQGAIQGALRFYTQAYSGGSVLNERMRISSAGNVGIGTTNPGAALEITGQGLIRGSSSATLRLNRNGVWGSVSSYIQWETDSAGTDMWKLGMQANSTNNIYLMYNSGAVMTMLTGGNVGIGTTGPVEKLDVVGNLSVGPASGLSSIHRGTVSGSNGIQLSGNINSAVSDANPGAYINVGGGSLTDTYEGNIVIAAYGAAIDDGNRNTIRFLNRSGVNTVAERMRITSAGNVGIGTTAPAVKLAVHGPAWIGIDNWDTQESSPQQVLRLYSNGISGVAPYSAFDFLTTAGWNYSNKLELRSWDYLSGQTGTLFTVLGNGNVGIGTTSPGYKFEVYGDIGTMSGSLNVRYTDGGCNKSLLAWGNFTVNGGNDTLGIYQYSDNRMALDARRDCSNNPADLIVNPSGGGVYKPGGGSFSDLSDMRLKTNIAPVSGALDKVTQLNPVLFDWVNPSEHSNAASGGGFIAQQVMKVFPEFVAAGSCHGDDCALVGGPGGTAYSLTLPFKFDAYLVGAIKELKAENDALKAENDAIKSRISKIEKKLQ